MSYQSTAKRSADGKAWHGILRDTSGKRSKIAWTCPHRHREEVSASNCAYDEGQRRSVQASQDAGYEVVMPTCDFTSSYTSDTWVSKLCLRCRQMVDHPSHLVTVKTAARPADIEKYLRWLGPRIGYEGGRGGIKLNGRRVAASWYDLSYALGFRLHRAVGGYHLPPPTWEERQRRDPVTGIIQLDSRDATVVTGVRVIR